MTKCKHFINLTNGIEYIPELKNVDYSFIRIQSTACEQKRWNFIIQDMDNNFFMCLALGYKCHIYDCGARKIIPRSFYQGIEFIKFALEKNWFNRSNKVVIKRSNRIERDCTNYFNEIYKGLSRNTLNKLKYFRKFLQCDNINIVLHCKSTSNDNSDYYKNIIRESYNV